MPRLVYTHEAKIPCLPHLAILRAINDEGLVARGAELLSVGEVERERDGLAAEPVADVVRVAVIQRYAHAVVQDHLEIIFEDGEDEVARVVKAEADGVAGVGGVVEIHTERLLRRGHVEELFKVRGGSGIAPRVPDVVDAAAAVGVVWPLDEGAAERGGLRARFEVGERVAQRLGAVRDVVLAAAGDGVGQLHEVVDGVVDGFDAVSVVHGELGIVAGLDALVVDAVADTKSVHLELDALRAAVGNGPVLVVKVVVEARAVVAAVGFGPEVEGARSDLSVELREIAEEALQDMVGTHGGHVGCCGPEGVDDGILAVDGAE